MPHSDPLARLLEPSLVTIFRYLRRRTTEEARAQALSFTQASALRWLGKHGVMRMNELASLLELSGSACSTMIDQLEKRGLVEKRDDVEDRRATLVNCTLAGENLSGDIVAGIYRQLAGEMLSLGSVDRHAVLGGLEVLAKLIEQSAAGG